VVGGAAARVTLLVPLELLTAGVVLSVAVNLSPRHLADTVVVDDVALAHGLGCVVTAEGVETPETAAWLAEAGCDPAPGYLYASPAPGRRSRPACPGTRTGHGGRQRLTAPPRTAAIHTPSAPLHPPDTQRPVMTRSLPRLRLTAVIAAVLVGTAGCGGAPADPAAVTTPHDPDLAASLPADIREAGVLRLRTDAAYPPVNAFGPDGRTVVGFEPDLAAAVGRVLGVRVEFVVGDFTEALDRHA
jgi:hypothetical protein